MPSEILALTDAYGPFIHAGTQNRGDKEAWRQPHPYTYGLWGSEDGILDLRLGKYGETRRFQAPIVLLVPPGEGHVVTAPTASRWYCLRFDLTRLPRQRIARGRHRAWCHVGPVQPPSMQEIWGSSPPPVVPDPLCAGALEVLRDCCALWWRDDVCHAQANASLGKWLLDYVQAMRADSHPGPDDRDLAGRCRKLIRERLSFGIGVKDLARACGYSRSHFIRLFRAESWITPGRLILEERMAEARRLLAAHDWSVDQIARSCGYGSTAAFSRAFAAMHQCPPATWRRRLR